VPSQLLDYSIVKVARVAHERAGNVVGVLQAVKGIVNERELVTFPELELPALVGIVQIVHPGVVGGGMLLLYMVLELDNVGIWNVLGIRRGKEWSSIMVDGADAEERAGRGNGR
jgi:hypothetical protein